VISGEQQYIVLDTASQSTKSLDKLKLWGTPDYAYGSVDTSGRKEKSLRKAFKCVDLKDALLPLGIKPESQNGRTNLTVNDIFSCKSSIPTRNKLGRPNY